MGFLKRVFGIEPKSSLPKAPEVPLGNAERDSTKLYGGENTWHKTNYLDVETHNGTVVSVWFRCCALPFKQTEVESARALQMVTIESGGYQLPEIRGIMIRRK